MSVTTVDTERLIRYCRLLFEAQGVPESEAELTARHIVAAELYGLSSHGVSRVPVYIRRLKEGVVEPRFRCTVMRETAGTEAWDVQNSIGIVAATRAMQRCIDKARSNGVAMITVKNSNHCGMTGQYTKLAADQNMIGFCASNAPALMAPTGSSSRYLGTNPLSVAAPTHGDSVMLDMATSVVAMGKVALAKRLEKSIPEGWAIDRAGLPTTDPAEALQGAALPFGGAKGYGIALFVDILSGILSGGSYGPYLHNLVNDYTDPQEIGHIFCVVDVAAFTDCELFKTRLETMTREIKALPRCPGIAEIYVPGEIEFQKKRKNESCGLELPDQILQDLQELGETYKIAASL